MNDLNKLLKDFYDNRLSYKQVYQAKFEALLSAIVEDIEALKAIKRGPGRPPKDEANG